MFCPRRASVTGALLLLGLLATRTAKAESIPEGTIEVGPELSYDRSSVSFDGETLGTIHTARVRLGVGYFLSSRLELRSALAFQYNGVDPETGPETHQSGLGGELGVAYHFPLEGAILPYLFLDLGVSGFSGDGVGDDAALTLPAVGGGIRIPIGDSGLASASVAYRHTENAIGTAETELNDIGVQVGISLLRRPRAEAR